jgi:hypothetical protein
MMTPDIEKTMDIRKTTTFAALLMLAAVLALGVGCGGASKDADSETSCTDRVDNDGDGDADQADDCDGDGIGDACQDSDGDGLVDADDNCCQVPNSEQRNRDATASADDPTASLGNACDPAESYAYAEWAIELPTVGGANLSELPGPGGGVLATGDLDNDDLADFVIGAGGPEGPAVFFVPGHEAANSTADDPTYTVTDENILVSGGQLSFSAPVVHST